MFGAELRYQIVSAAILGLVLIGFWSPRLWEIEDQAVQQAQVEVAATRALIVYGDTVSTATNFPVAQQTAHDFTLANRFPRNSEVVWRIEVVDPRTALPMDDVALRQVAVRLPDGTTIPLVWRSRTASEQMEERFWTGVWTVPSDYPPGVVPYVVTATARDGRSGEFRPLRVSPSLLTITDEVLDPAALHLTAAGRGH